MEAMATLASVHIKSDLEQRLERQAERNEITKEEFVVSVIETALEEQEYIRNEQDDSTMIGVQQMLDGDYISIDEWAKHLEKTEKRLLQKYYPNET